MMNAFFWDVAPCRSRVHRHFGGMYVCSHKIYTAPTPRRRHSSLQCSFLKLTSLRKKIQGFLTNSPTAHKSDRWPRLHLTYNTNREYQLVSNNFMKHSPFMGYQGAQMVEISPCEEQHTTGSYIKSHESSP
jgi:hypothetical protein